MPRFLRILHQNAENGGMQMHVQVAVDVVERQTRSRETAQTARGFPAATVRASSRRKK